MKIILSLLFLLCICNTVTAQEDKEGKLKNKRVLVFTKNGKGYVHDNIPSSIAAIQKLGKELGFAVDTTTNSALFTDDNMKKYDAVIFSNSNNNVFDTEEQKVAFMRYIQAGGSFVGIHSAAGTERNWPWFKLMMGATFLRHPPFQPFTVHVVDRTHPSTKNLQPYWEVKDEVYYFKEFNPHIKFILVKDISTIKEAENSTATKPDVFGNLYPVAWCHEFDGGKAWYTSLGHAKEDYSDPVYLTHLTEGLKWAVDKAQRDYKKARATSSAQEPEISAQ